MSKSVRDLLLRLKEGGKELAAIKLEEFPEYDGLLYTRMLTPTETQELRVLAQSVEPKTIGNHPSRMYLFRHALFNVDGTPAFPVSEITDKEVENGYGAVFDDLTTAVLLYNGYFKPREETNTTVKNS